MHYTWFPARVTTPTRIYDRVRVSINTDSGEIHVEGKNVVHAHWEGTVVTPDGPDSFSVTSTPEGDATVDRLGGCGCGAGNGVVIDRETNLAVT